MTYIMFLVLYDHQHNRYYVQLPGMTEDELGKSHRRTRKKKQREGDKAEKIRRD